MPIFQQIREYIALKFDGFWRVRWQGVVCMLVMVAAACCLFYLCYTRGKRTDAPEMFMLFIIFASAIIGSNFIER